jgi:adenylylsulfate kinase
MADGMHEPHESRIRSLTKAVTYRVIILILDFTAVYLLTGRYEVALGFMIVSNVYTSIAYYFHERFWSGIAWGMKGAAG